MEAGRATSIAAVIPTVLDERELLRRNVLYHRFLGIDQFYIYDDGSTDGSLETIEDLPYVVARSSVAESEVTIGPDLSRAAEQLDTHFVARQMLNMAHAMEQAKRSGASWIVVFDADELIVVDRLKAMPGALAEFLGRQPLSVDAVTFRPLEAVQRRARYDDVMTEETLFKIAASGATRETYDPFTKTKHQIDAVYGHKAGKQAVRLTIDAIPYSPHRFRRRGGRKLRDTEAGDLLHFYAPDFEQFVRKFRIMKDHPDTHVDGRTVVIQKRLWRDVVNKSRMSEDELRDYYERWVMFTDEQQRAMRGGRSLLLKRKPALVEVRSAAEAIKRLGAEDRLGA